jgi:hypothetical protein
VRGALWEEAVQGEGMEWRSLDGERTTSGMKEDEGNVRDSQSEVRNVEISSSVAGLTRRKSAFEKDG